MQPLSSLDNAEQYLRDAGIITLYEDIIAFLIYERPQNHLAAISKFLKDRLAGPDNGADRELVKNIPATLKKIRNPQQQPEPEKPQEQPAAASARPSSPFFTKQKQAAGAQSSAGAAASRPASSAASSSQAERREESEQSEESEESNKASEDDLAEVLRETQALERAAAKKSLPKKPETPAPAPAPAKAAAQKRAARPPPTPVQAEEAPAGGRKGRAHVVADIDAYDRQQDTAASDAEGEASELEHKKDSKRRGQAKEESQQQAAQPSRPVTGVAATGAGARQAAAGAAGAGGRAAAKPATPAAEESRSRRRKEANLESLE